MKALALKYRPKDFDDLVEQGPIKQILEEQVKTSTHQNAYLFTGGAGTGKTTSARIMANELNKGEGNPIELDAASNNSVNDVREIIIDSKFKSLDSEYKIYILDECHMFSTGAWNALLKLFEEPPAKSVFILCTTDPQKIPATIISRVQRFDFKRISYNGIIDRLEYILQEEMKEDAELIYNKEAIHYIAKLADGGMRDAITLLDKCISYDPELTVEKVIEALGSINYDTMHALTISICEKDIKEAIIILEQIYREGLDLKQFIKQYSYFILDICKYNLLGNFEYLQVPATLEENFKKITPEQSQIIYGLLNELVEINNIIKWEPSPKPIIQTSLMLFIEGI